MIKRTLYFGNPCYLRQAQNQLQITYPTGEKKSVPIEDIGLLMLDNQQITITQKLLASLSENNTAILNCNRNHLPIALMLPMAGHSLFTEKIHFQIKATSFFNNKLWQQTIKQKIQNQATVLEKHGMDANRLTYLATKVKVGDSENAESRAAFYYWKILFEDDKKFKRLRFGHPPNNLFNYGYAVLRAIIARDISASGLLNSLGIHHRNKYNPYCLADDLMEPYRPFVDELVLQIIKKYDVEENISKEIKKELLQIPVIDVLIKKKKSPLMIATKHTCVSLLRCYEKKSKQLLFATFPNAKK